MATGDHAAARADVKPGEIDSVGTGASPVSKNPFVRQDTIKRKEVVAAVTTKKRKKMGVSFLALIVAILVPLAYGDYTGTLPPPIDSMYNTTKTMVSSKLQEGMDAASALLAPPPPPPKKKGWF